MRKKKNTYKEITFISHKIHTAKTTRHVSQTVQIIYV